MFMGIVLCFTVDTHSIFEKTFLTSFVTGLLRVAFTKGLLRVDLFN